MNIKKRSYPTLLLVLLCITACKKDILISQLTTENKIEDAKRWYSSQTKENVSTLKSDNGIEVSLEQEPLWDKVQTTELEDKTLVITLPVKTNMYDVIGKKGDLNLVITNKNGVNEYKFIKKERKGYA